MGRLEVGLGEERIFVRANIHSRIGQVNEATEGGEGGGKWGWFREFEARFEVEEVVAVVEVVLFVRRWLASITMAWLTEQEQQRLPKSPSLPAHPALEHSPFPSHSLSLSLPLSLSPFASSFPPEREQQHPAGPPSCRFSFLHSFSLACITSAKLSPSYSSLSLLSPPHRRRVTTCSPHSPPISLSLSLSVSAPHFVT